MTKLLKVNTVYGMTLRERPTFAPGWHKLEGPVEFCYKVVVATVKRMDNGDQYFTFVPTGFSRGVCGFGAHRLSTTKGMVELGKAPPGWHHRVLREDSIQECGLDALPFDVR